MKRKDEDAVMAEKRDEVDTTSTKKSREGVLPIALGAGGFTIVAVGLTVAINAEHGTFMQTGAAIVVLVTLGLAAHLLNW